MAISLHACTQKSNFRFIFRNQKTILKKSRSKQKNQQNRSKQRRSLSDSDKYLNPLDKIEKAEYTQQIEKIAYAMTFPTRGSGENVKIKVMDYIESKLLMKFCYSVLL